jgi:putative spermidine/putrescine transport system substrate-binding protein
MRLLNWMASTSIAVGLLTTAATAGEITVVSWGGDYAKSQDEAYFKPWAAATGNKVKSVDADNPKTPIKAQVEAGNVSIDVADVEFSDAVRYCDEGLLEPLDTKDLPAGVDGTAADKDFIEGALGECSVANIVFSTIFAYDTTKFAGDKPTSMADFFDVAKFPGKRGLRKDPKANLEMALMADGVPAAEVYAMLGTKEGVDRAFKKLDQIKGNVVWWEAGSQPPQLLADGEVAMTTAYNGRIFSAQVKESKPFAIVWDGQILDMDFFVIPKGAPNKELAWDFIKFSTGSKPLADQAAWISYGPARKSSGPLVGKFNDGKTDMGPHMPTAEANMGNALVNSFEFWADHNDDMQARFATWLAS